MSSSSDLYEKLQTGGAEPKPVEEHAKLPFREFFARDSMKAKIKEAMRMGQAKIGKKNGHS